MALVRLLLVKPVLHFNTIGIPKSTRWFCSSSSSSNGKGDIKPANVKGPEEADENGAVANESYMEMHPKVFPKAAEFQNKTGRPWYTVKGILTSLKEKILGNPQYQKQITNEISHSKVDSDASEVILTKTCGDITKSGESTSLPHSSEVPIDSHSSEESASTCITFHLLEENSEDVVDVTVCPDSNKLCVPESTDQAAEILKEFSDETENIVQFSEATQVSLSNEKPTSISVLSCVTGGKHSGKMVQAEEISSNSNVVKPENGQRMLEEAMFGTLGKSVENQKKEPDQLFSFTRHLLDKAFEKTKSENANASTPLGSGTCAFEKKTVSSVQTLNNGNGLDKIPSLSDGSKKVMRLAELFKKMMNNHTAGETTGKSGDLSTHSESSNNFEGTSQVNLARTLDVESLISHVKELPRKHSSIKSQDTAMSNLTDQISNKGSIHNIRSQDKLQNSDAEKIRTLLRGHSGVEDHKMRRMKEEKIVGIPSSTKDKNMIKIEGCSSLDVAANDQTELEPRPQVLPTSKEDIDQTTVTCITEGHHTENKVLIRFLNKDVKDSDIKGSLGHCGTILKIQKVSPFKGSNFIDAFIHFKTNEGLQKAIQKTDILIRNSPVFIEATSQEEMADKIPIPNLIGDPDIPVALVKNPTHTIKIKQLTHDMSSHQLREGLSFCNSRITNFFLGTSSATAYVEFETEDAKERAIAKHSLSISGKQLLIFRVDAPRTTVVRIQNINANSFGRVKSICKPYGKILQTSARANRIVDVHFCIAEWPNMLNILNSVNGLEVDGRQWIAQPAPIFSPAILQILWSHPEERKHVKAVMRSLLRKLKHSINVDEITDLAAKQYGVGA